MGNHTSHTHNSALIYYVLDIETKQSFAHSGQHENA